MSEPRTSPNKRRQDESDPPATADSRRKRRAFLQTMGQQLREFGPDGTSPRDHNRGTFGTSPSSHRGPAAVTGESGHAASAQDVTPESDAVPGEDDRIPAGAARASKWLWNANEVLPVSLVQEGSSFPFEDLLNWSQSYFDHWHPAFPFIHAPSLLEYFRQLAHGGASTAFYHTILRSVMSISLADRRQMLSSQTPVPSSLVFHSFNDAMNSIQCVLTEESSVLSLQALVSVQLFLVTMHRYNAASRLEGLAVRIAFQLGLHKCPAKTTAVPKTEVELRKRLFWSIFCIDRYICIRLGTPLAIRLEDIDVCYPHAERHGMHAGEVEERDDRLDLLQFLTHHADVRGSIMELRNKSAMISTTSEDDQAMNIDAEHTRWWNLVDEYLSNAEETQIPMTKVHQVTLIVLRFESILALHRSVLATSKKNSAYNAALQRCISASRSIINTLHNALQGFGAFDGSPGQSGYQATPLIWPSFTWAVWMAAFIVVFAATEDQVPRPVACRLADRSINILKHLSLRGTNWPEACIVAIQNLVARLKGRSSRDSTAEATRQRSSTPLLMSSRNADPQYVRTRPSPLLNEQERGSNHATQLGSHSLFSQQRRLTPAMQQTFQSSQFRAQPGPGTNMDAFVYPTMGAQVPTLQHITNLANAHLSSSGTFLGIAKQLSDNPMPDDDIMHLFNGEDMAFWMGGEFGGS